MKVLFVCLFVLFINLTDQVKAQGDSISVRVLNQGRYYLKELTVEVNGKNYTFKNIWKSKYSAPQKLPYIYYINNLIHIVVIRKRLLNYDDWMGVIFFPIDHIGDRKYTEGKVLLTVHTKRKKKNLVASVIVTQE